MTRQGMMVAAAGLVCMANAGAAPAEDDVFKLGQITVTSTRPDGETQDGAVSREDMWTFDRDTLDEAVKLVPGVGATFDSNGRRNEHDILVRGFGRWQVPLSIDGIRVYLPADNRLDFTRFLTMDLAEVQVRKGYVSVLDGPGGMGGAINLVTRKPTRAFESSFQGGSSFDGEGYEGWSGSAMLGTRQEKYYLQASGSYLDRDHWTLSDSFTPTSMEDGGERNGSDNRDWRINLKAGITPNQTDEYSLSYTSQSGAKGAPLQVYNNPPNPPNSYWRWPWWDTENLYWLSNTQLGAGLYLKSRLFYNTFGSGLDAYDDATYTTQSANQRFRSVYKDSGYGGSVEAGAALGAKNVLKVAAHYRRDEHTERNFNRRTSPTFATVEPLQTTRENTWSLALENTFQATGAIDVVAGVSYDRNELELAQEYNTTAGLFEYPTRNSSALNAQGAAHWRYDERNLMHVSVSSRTRFPTIFERYSTRFGTAVPNPELTDERATNYELGWEGSFAGATKLSAAVFYSDIQNMIQTVIITAAPQTTQTRNVGDGESYGVELAADTEIGSRLQLGANYSYLKRRIDFLTALAQPKLQPTGTPVHQGFAYLSYRPSASFTLTPSIELADDRWSEVTTNTYVQTGSYVLANLQARFQSSPAWEVAVGGRNLLDRNFQLAYGYPEPGRTYYAKLRLNF